MKQESIKRVCVCGYKDVEYKFDLDVVDSVLCYICPVCNAVSNKSYTSVYSFSGIKPTIQKSI